MLKTARASIPPSSYIIGLIHISKQFRPRSICPSRAVRTPFTLLPFLQHILDTLYRPHHMKMCLRVDAENEGPDQSAHPRSLIRAFAVRKQNHWILYNVSMERKCLDETLRMCRMM